MTDFAEICVRPYEEGSWGWLGMGPTGEVLEMRDNLEDRGAAIAAAREQAGVESIKITYPDGSEDQASTPALCRVVLQRADGSEVGELEPAPSAPAEEA